MSKLTIRDLNLKDKTVLIRVDYNVPLDKSSRITDEIRIKASLPTIKFALEHEARVVLISHLGRPKNGPTPELSLAPCAKRLSELLGKKVLLAPDCIGNSIKQLVHNLKSGDIILLENVRFHAAEEKPELDPHFAKELAALGDYYVNDAFGAAHRAHSSTVEICKYFPEKSAMGLLMEKEVQNLGKLLLHPKRPFFAIIGGAKISSKIGVIKSLLHKADALLIGGGMAYNFSKAMGIDIGGSIHDDKYLPVVKEILEEAKTSKTQLYFPQDFVIANRIDQGADIKIVSAKQDIPKGYEGVDIGPETVKNYVKLLQSAATVFWNGPLGIFECPPFDKGTVAIAKAIAQLKANIIVGGGESLSAVYKAGVAEQITHLSTGGGASLEFLEDGTLPGIEALSETKNNNS